MSVSTLRIDNKEDFDLEPDYIAKLCSLEKNTISIIGHEKIAANLTKVSGTFKAEVEARFSDDDDDGNFQFAIHNKIYETKSLEAFRVTLISGQIKL